MVSKSRILRARIQREAEGYLELGMPRQALNALARLGDPAEFDFHGLYLRGEALRELERYGEALVPLIRAAEAAPEDVRVWFALGWCYKRTGQIEMAIGALERALALEPAEALVHYNLACYWGLTGDAWRAVKFLSHALRLAPDYRQLIADESDFDPIRSHPEFQALCKNSRPRGRRRQKGPPPGF